MSDLADSIVRWELGISSAEDDAELAHRLRDPAARRQFVHEARVAALLATPPTAGRPRLTRAHPPARARRAHGSGRRQAVGWAVAAALILAIAVPALRDKPAPALPSPAAIARLGTTADGARIIAGDGSTRAAAAGAELFAGDLLIAGGGPAGVTLSDDAAELSLSAGGRLRLPEQHPRLELALVEGRLQAQVRARQPDAPFVVSTPTARIEVVGTGFTLAAQPTSTRLHVTSGVVRLVGPDTPLLVGAGRSALSADGITGYAPGSAPAAAPVPGLALWQPDPLAAVGWRAVSEDPADGGPAWRAVPGEVDNPWVSVEIRTPIAASGWMVGADTRLRFRYQVEDLPADGYVEVHLKPKDESNFALRITPAAGPGWHEVTLPLAGFRHLMDPQRQPLPGERIHGATWLASAPAPGAPRRTRFWIRDVVAFTSAP